jgi:hypothetical protein
LDKQKWLCQVQYAGYDFPHILVPAIQRQARLRSAPRKPLIETTKNVSNEKWTYSSSDGIDEAEIRGYGIPEAMVK